MYFSELKDSHRTNKGNFQHQLSDVLLLTISAMLCQVDDWSSVTTFGKNHLGWLRKCGHLTNGLPSQDTLERVFTALNPKYFNQCFMNWMKAIRNNVSGKVIVIEGKGMRGARDTKASKNMPYIVSA